MAADPMACATGGSALRNGRGASGSPDPRRTQGAGSSGFRAGRPWPAQPAGIRRRPARCGRSGRVPASGGCPAHRACPSSAPWEHVLRGRAERQREHWVSACIHPGARGGGRQGPAVSVPPVAAPQLRPDRPVAQAAGRGTRHRVSGRAGRIDEEHEGVSKAGAGAAKLGVDPAASAGVGSDPRGSAASCGRGCRWPGLTQPGSAARTCRRVSRCRARAGRPHRTLPCRSGDRRPGGRFGLDPPVQPRGIARPDGGLAGSHGSRREPAPHACPRGDASSDRGAGVGPSPPQCGGRTLGGFRSRPQRSCRFRACRCPGNGPAGRNGEGFYSGRSSPAGR